MALTKDVVAVWEGALNFRATMASGQEVFLSDNPAQGISPIETLVIGFAGCMGMDVISILQKKRQDVTALEARVHGERAEEHPKKYTAMQITLIVRGRNIDPEAVRRAIELSNEKYCSVAATLRPTVTITTAFEVHSAV